MSKFYAHKSSYVQASTPINEVIYRISDFGLGMTLVKNDDGVIQVSLPMAICVKVLR